MAMKPWFRMLLADEFARIDENVRDVAGRSERLTRRNRNADMGGGPVPATRKDRHQHSSGVESLDCPQAEGDQFRRVEGAPLQRANSDADESEVWRSAIAMPE